MDRRPDRAGRDRCALTGPLLTPDETAHIAGLYDDDTRFRATIDMARYRFGLGEYRYFKPPFPDAITELKEAPYPRLLPIAREWWARPEPPDPVAGHPAGEARLVQPASATPAGSSSPTSSALALSRRRPSSSSRTDTRCPDMVRSFMCGTRGVFRQELVAIS